MISLKKDIILFDKKENCCGCWACKNICPKNAIEMTEDKEGFLFPTVNKSLCIGCSLCEQVCPLKKRSQQIEMKQNQPHIRIINFSEVDNYGAVIAGACLEKMVRSIVDKHYVVETISYETLYTIPSFKNRLTAEKEAWATLFKAILRRLHIISTPKKPKTKHYKKIVSYSPLKKHRYNRFRCDYLNMTPTATDASLAECRDNTKALICGSDIIWSPIYIKKNLGGAFYLNFGDEKTKRISYAASLDCFNGKELYSCRREYQKRLKNFDYISIRERCNMDFIQSVAPKEVHCCCDPVFLCENEFFNDMISSSDENFSDEKYIYVYVLSHNETIVEYAKKLAKEKNLKIFYYSADILYDFGKSGVNCSSDGPAEFLHRIKNAEYVVTTSFHCVAFSLLFEKKFIAFRRDGMGPKIDNILEIVGLPERLVEDNSVFDIDEPIDFEKVRFAINKERESSLQFLKDALL